MFKKICFLSSILLTFVPFAFGQSSASGNVNVTATVLQGLTVTGTKGLDFGIQTPSDGTVSIASTNASAGLFTISGNPGSSVTVSFTPPANLANGGNDITFTADTPVHNTSNTQGSATAFSTTSGGTVTLDASTGNLYVWIGGSIDVSSAATGLTYTGTYTTTVNY